MVDSIYDDIVIPNHDNYNSRNDTLPFEQESKGYQAEQRGSNN